MSSINLVLLQLKFLILISISQSTFIKYGEICRIPENFDNYAYPDYSETDLEENPDICNFINGKCIDNKCQCLHPELMVYNSKLNECGIPTGQSCNETDETVDGCFRGNECVDGICRCQTPREPITLSDGSLTCTKLRREECKHDEECSSNEFLSCFDGYCDCKNPMRTVFEYTDETKGCRIRAGETCTSQLQVDLDELYFNSTVPAPQQCVTNSICKNSKKSSNKNANWSCSCYDGYISTPEGECKKDFSRACTPTHQECNSYKGLTCKNESCVCIDEDTCYDPIQKKCVSYVDQPCGSFSLWYDEYDIGCVRNAECVLETNSAAATLNNETNLDVLARKVCKCKAGFVEETNGGGDEKQCVTMPVEESNMTSNNGTAIVDQTTNYNNNAENILAETDKITTENSNAFIDYDYSVPNAL